MAATTSNPTPAALTEVLFQTIVSNAQMLRMLSPERYQQMVQELLREPAINAVSSEAWDDLERWMVALREQDRASVTV